jgi:predicted helicase
MTERLGIVYTPVEVVDFILHSVNEVLQAEFGQTLGSKGVHIMDPFTGTGTFITRLLQSGLIRPDELAWKYANEIHANEIVLLAYYIAAINIEAVYHSLSGGDYKPFEGICLTDTFQLYEQKPDLIAHLMPDNSNRRTRQKALDIRVIIGNPPYSVGQAAPTTMQPMSLTRLNASKNLRARSSATIKMVYTIAIFALFRWASDRIGDAGIVAYVSNAGWVDNNQMDGLRKCLADEFSSIHVFHLRGNQRTSGELRAVKAARFSVRQPHPGSHRPAGEKPQGRHPREHPFSRHWRLPVPRRQAGDHRPLWQYRRHHQSQRLAGHHPDEHGDWLGQRDSAFEAFMPIGDKDDKTAKALFTNSTGVQTNRDAWCFNSDKKYLSQNMKSMIYFYNIELNRFNSSNPGLSRKLRSDAVDSFIDNDAKNKLV